MSNHTAWTEAWKPVLHKNWWNYIILRVIDVEANYMVVRAYEYTNLTTIQVQLFTVKSIFCCFVLGNKVVCWW